MLSSLTFTALAAALSLSLTFVNAAPTSVHRLKVRDSNGPVITNEYIVKLKDTANTANHINSLPFAFSVADTDSPVNYAWNDDFFKGYSGTFIGAALDAILASPDVEYVEKNAIFSISDSQNSAPWNLQAISTQNTVGSTDVTAMSFTYSYTQPAGDGVDIYIVDTGVYTDNAEFEGRATFGFAAGQFQKRDGHGHGTHCAGSAAGKTYGVAKKASIIGVKVLADNGQGSTADIVDGLNWVLTNAKSTGKPSIASMSLGGETSQALDDAVSKLIAGGVQVAVAAGNEAQDAQNTSPAHVPEAITVGASDIQNAIASFSNFGAAVDVFAPGVNITSAWIGGPDKTRMISGTSMATPQVAGLAAYLLSKDTSMTPAALVEKIKSLATQNVITGAPSGTITALVFNGGSGDSAPAPPSSSSSVELPTSAELPTSTDSVELPTASAIDPPSPTTSDPATPTETGDLSESLFTCPDWWPSCPWNWSNK